MRALYPKAPRAAQAQAAAGKTQLEFNIQPRKLNISGGKMGIIKAFRQWGRTRGRVTEDLPSAEGGIFMSEKSFLGAQRIDSAELSQSPAPPTMAEAREDGASVSRLAQDRLPVYVRENGLSASARIGRKAGHGAAWSALSFGVLLLASLGACLERLAWMGQR